MHKSTAILGALIAVGGIVLVATHGTIGGVNILKPLGIPCLSGSSGNNTTYCSAFGGYSVGTIVLLAGGSMLIRGLTASSPPQLPAMGAGMSPELMAAMMAARTGGFAPPGSVPPTPTSTSTAPTPATAVSATPIRYCPSCGQRNELEAAFCQKCGRPMPPPTP
jgi:hypothetical protein